MAKSIHNKPAKTRQTIDSASLLGRYYVSKPERVRAVQWPGWPAKVAGVQLDPCRLVGVEKKQRDKLAYVKHVGIVNPGDLVVFDADGRVRIFRPIEFALRFTAETLD